MTLHRMSTTSLRVAVDILPRVAAIGAAIGAVLVAKWVLSDTLQSDEAAVIGLAGLVAIVLVVVAFTPGARIGSVLGNVKSVTIGSLGIQLEDYKRLAAHEATDSAEIDPEHSETLLDLKIRLEAKFTYLAKHVLAPDADPAHLVPTFLTVGSLGYDGYLGREETKRAYEILGMRDVEFRSVPVAEQRIFLDGANKFVSSVRADVFTGQVTVEICKQGWSVSRLYPDIPRRRDLLVEPKSGEAEIMTHYVIPVFAYQARSRLVRKAEARLRTELPVGGGGRFVVVPPRSKAAGPVKVGDVSVVTLSTLLQALKCAS